jgi:LPXTG-motif cell wall-anchored protein
VVVTATGFAPNSFVYVRFQSETVPVGVFQADAQGVVSLTLTVPDGLPPGEHDVIVEGFAPDGSVRQFVQPFVVPAPVVTLPRTGTQPWPWLTISIVLLAAGAAALALARTRRAPRS